MEWKSYMSKKEIEHLKGGKNGGGSDTQEREQS